MSGIKDNTHAPITLTGEVQLQLKEVADVNDNNKAGQQVMHIPTQQATDCGMDALISEGVHVGEKDVTLEFKPTSVDVEVKDGCTSNKGG